MNKITRDNILKGQKATKEVVDNVDKLVKAINEFIKDYPHTLTITSGYRSPEHNAAIGGASKSNHCMGLAVDFADKDCRFWLYVLNNLDKAKTLGLYFENKQWTTVWVHIQLKEPKSGKRIFVPNSNPPTDTTIWDGIYKEP